MVGTFILWSKYTATKEPKRASPSPINNLFQGSTLKYFYASSFKIWGRVIESVRTKNVPIAQSILPPI
jgi:hypothetical protein